MKYNNEERGGVLSVSKIFVDDLKWIFREQAINDFGVDAFVEITSSPYPFKDIIPTGRLLAVQIKSGKSFFKETTSAHFVYRGNKKYMKYWQNHSIPVIIILYDKESWILRFEWCQPFRSDDASYYGSNDAKLVCY